MLSTKLKEAAGNSADATLYSNDVFSTYLYTGNGSTQTITNGIDLAGKGGLVWCKSRMPFDASGNVTNHVLMDSITNGRLRSNTTGALLAGQNITRLSSGFTVTGTELNSTTSDGTPPNNYVSWTFRKAAKFFDVVTYTGTGSARTIAHSLGVAPGMVMVKRTDTSSDWQVYSNGLTSAAYSIQLNLTNAQASAPTVWNSTAPTSSVFSVGTDATVNASGGTYVAYLYAHDTSSTGIIQCGSFTADGTGTGTVTLGWEPQYIMVKKINASGNWVIDDSMRGWNVGGQDSYLLPNSSVQEGLYEGGYPTATGFVNLGGYTAGDNLIYMAIRMPNKPPTTGTQVFSPNAVTTVLDNNTLPSAGFPIDMAWLINRGVSNKIDVDRLRGKGGGALLTDTTNSEFWTTFFNFDAQTNLYITGTLDGNSAPYIFYNFKRAPGFFDVVCYTGTGSATTQAHNLTVAPELMIVKCRSTVTDWGVYNSDLGNTKYLWLDSANSASVASSYWNNTSPTPTNFSVKDNSQTNTSGATYVAYLFATLAGIQYINSYVGDGTTGRVINCGFSAGARFICIKATSTTGSWWVWDSARGITSGNDPALQLNSTAAEITSADAIDPSSSGFIVNQEATCSINASGVSYLVWAIA